MADSITKRIAAQVVTVIGALGVPAGVTVNKTRDTAVALNELPMYSVYLDNEHADPQGQPRRPVITKRELDLAVKIRVNGTDDDIDPHRQWIIASIIGDPSLGGLATNVTEGDTEWDSEEGTDGSFTATIIHFKVEYQTKPADITARQ
jgi:hypothetical protein